MSIDHFFDRPKQAAPPETGEERRLLLEANHELKRQNSLLQARVDELAGQVSKGQRAAMDKPTKAPPTSLPSQASADRYLQAVRSIGKPCTPREIAKAMGLDIGYARKWLKLYAKAFGISEAGLHYGIGRPAQLYEIRAAP